MDISISNLAAKGGITADTIRYYERIGVLPSASRTASGYRVYGDDALERVRFVKGAQSLGLRLDAIRELLDIRDRGGCLCGHTEKLPRER